MKKQLQHDTAAIVNDMAEKIKSSIEQALTSLASGADLVEIERQFELLFQGLAGQIIGHCLESFLSEPSTLSALKKIGGERCLRFKGMRHKTLVLGCGGEMSVRSPYFISKTKRRGKKKAGPNGTGTHLGLEAVGCFGRRSPLLVSRMAQVAILAPSFEVGDRLLREWNINTSVNSLRRSCALLARKGIGHRGRISLAEKENIDGYSLVIG